MKVLSLTEWPGKYIQTRLLSFFFFSYQASIYLGLNYVFFSQKAHRIICNRSRIQKIIGERGDYVEQSISACYYQPRL